MHRTVAEKKRMERCIASRVRGPHNLARAIHSESVADRAAKGAQVDYPAGAPQECVVGHVALEARTARDLARVVDPDGHGAGTTESSEVHRRIRRVGCINSRQKAAGYCQTQKE